MKYLTYFLFILTHLSFSQTEKIRIRKESGCDFLFLADTSLAGKSAWLSGFTVSGKISSREAKNIRSKIHLIREKECLITKDAFSELLREACVIDKIKISEVKIEKDNNTRSDHFLISILYVNL